MAITILMPAIEPSARTGRLARWLRREGEFVEAGDPVAEIATAHATMDVEAPRAGILTRLLVAAGAADIAVNAEIATLEPGPASHLAPCGGADAEGAAAPRACWPRRAPAGTPGRRASTSRK